VKKKLIFSSHINFFQDKENWFKKKINRTKTHQMDYLTKTREELIAICKEKSIKGYSGKKKTEIISLLAPPQETDDMTTKEEFTRTEFPVENFTNKKLTYVDLFSGIFALFCV
jgi:predicted GIY-YIG superfamily endonuclease